MDGDAMREAEVAFEVWWRDQNTTIEAGVFPLMRQAFLTAYAQGQRAAWQEAERLANAAATLSGLKACLGLAADCAPRGQQP